MMSYKKLFSKKIIITIIFITFSVFWFGDFIWAFIYMILTPIVCYFYEKNNSTIKDITDNHSYVVSTTLVILIAYIGFMAQYLSIQNPNKVFDKNNLIIDTYYIPEYKSVRTRSDYVLLVKNKYGDIAINCSAFTYGRCPYAHQYKDSINIGFVKVRKTFSQFIYGIDNTRIAYYIKYKDDIISSDYFLKKYDNEMRKVYLFLISLNLYIIFLCYIKKIYRFNLSKSFAYIFSDPKKAIYCIYLSLFIFILPIIKFIL